MKKQDWQVTGSDVSLSGIHIALVVDNNDPKAMERVLVRVIGIHDMSNDKLENALWADRMAFSKFSSGDIPDVGDFLYVQFINNDPMHILWMGWVRSLQG